MRRGIWKAHPNLQIGVGQFLIFDLQSGEDPGFHLVFSLELIPGVATWNKPGINLE